MDRSSRKSWGGRFSEKTDSFVEKFTESVSFDSRLYYVDILGSIAHANGLVAAGVLSSSDRDTIVEGLKEIRREIESGEFVLSVALEDVHSNIEARLVDLVGELGKKLHTGRSRNDQVTTDIRLWLRNEIDQIDEHMTRLLRVLVDHAEEYAGTIMPGLTHMQNAQPVTFGHHLMAWFEMMFRDRSRLRDCRKRLNSSPLGAAALAGTSFDLPREQTAAELGFESLCRNSLDAVSDRDFAIEFVSVASTTMVHLTRWCEEIIIWSSDIVGFIRLPDAFCTGSSIMPQKKNPDVPELIRGKAGRIFGDLMALLTMVKSQPLAYNRDNQEDKERVFDSVDTLSECIQALCLLIPEIEPDSQRMYECAQKGYSTATDLADWLVGQDVPFRKAHEIVGRVVAEAESKNIRLDELSLEQLREIDDRFDKSVYASLTVEGSVDSRSLLGGTSPSSVRAEIEQARNRI